MQYCNSLSKQIIHSDGFLDKAAVFVGGEAVGRDKDGMDALFAPCQSLVGGDFVADAGIVGLVDEVLADAEFHFAQVDDAVGTANDEVDLRSGVFVRGLGPP